MNVKWKKKSHNKSIEDLLMKKGKNKIVARLLSQRNIKDYEVFLSAEYKRLSHPYDLHDVKKASEIFCEIVESKGRVAIIGDYDCDGIVSSVMLKELCNNFSLHCDVFLPSRLEHGYGLNEKTIEAFKNRIKQVPDLLIVTDCGMNSKAEIEELYSYGIKKIIIIDHHTGDEDKIANNADALVTWHLSKDFNEMCACGEVFQFIRGIYCINKNVNPIEFLTYASLGTIADVSPIIGDNRVIVKNGLSEEALNHVLGLGLSALLKESKIHPSSITQEDVAFKIAPRINAVGRMDKPDIVKDLLLERNVEIAEKITEHIIEYNQDRKKTQNKIAKEAQKKIETENFSHGIMVIGKDWHIGVVGIVASRLAETYNKPTVVIGHCNGKWKGSGRTIGNINLKSILDSCSEIFENYGGHSGAVGVTLKEDFLEKAPEIFNDACKKYLEKNKVEDVPSLFDANLNPIAITPTTAQQLLELYPYCKENNSEPIFKISNVIVQEAEYIEKETWKLLKFFVAKDDVKIPYSFKTFSPPCGSEIEGRKADIFFKFPQKTQDPINPFFKFDLNVVDINLL